MIGVVLLFSLGLLPLCSLGLDFTCPLRGGSVVAWGYCGYRRIDLRLFDWLVSVSLFGLLQSVPYLATISAGHRAGALTFLGHWVLGRSSFVGLSHNPKYSGFLLSSAGFCEPRHLFFALPVSREPNLSDCLPQCEDLSNRQGVSPHVTATILYGRSWRASQRAVFDCLC